MNLRRLLSLCLCVFALYLGGCSTAPSYTSNVVSRNRFYRKIHITDLQGTLIADWIAEGYVWRNGQGYRFRAVERTVGGPFPQTMRYPQGRKVYVNGPNIVVMPCEKPAWLAKLEGF